MIRNIFRLTFFILIAVSRLAADSTSITDTVYACRTEAVINIDGRLDEPCWRQAVPVTEFRQLDPREGDPPSQKTSVYVVYDHEALYVGARLWDSAPDSIIALLSRKDGYLDCDAFGIFIDPYLDRRSGFYFAMTAAGTYFDGVLLNDEWDDDSWDGIWEGRTRIDSSGWTAEFRIPYSQLRFRKQEKYQWGINFRRDIKRNNEKIYLAYTPKSGSGFVSRFPILTGIEDIEPQNQLEIMPYVRAKAEYLTIEPGDPFYNGARYTPGFGGDIKYGLSSNLTLDGTINPDFGQVEVDPAVVNLSDVETYFSEKRPFFIEGASIFEFGYGGSRSNWGFNWSNPTFFYSRRIGKVPGGSLPAYEYADVPDGTQILGAAKVTGKIGDNWNIGMVHALTNREYAEIYNTGSSSSVEVEPMSYYGIIRSQKEIDSGFRGIGMIGTLSRRFFRDIRLENQMNRSAYSFGVDGWTFLDTGRNWVVTGWGGMSHIRGNQQRMIDVQRSSRHYFQRPDAGHVSVDSQANHLTGYAGRIAVNKQKGNVIFNSAFGFITPGFDINDLGFLWRADVINSHVGFGYEWTDRTAWFHESQLIGALFGSMDYDRNVTWAGFFADYWIKFHNFYTLDIMYAYNPETVSNRLTRGGPLTVTPPGFELNLWFSSDDRNPFIVHLNTYGYYRSPQEWNRSVSLSFEFKPLPNIRFILSPGIEFIEEFSQWIGAFSDPFAQKTYQSRYVFGEMTQTEFSASVRLNWTFTPHLSLQLYVQPLISVGDYGNFKELDRPESYEFNIYGSDGSTIVKKDGEYTVDPDGEGPAGSFSFNDPDFNIKSLRANAVLRWEYIPGSVLYLVWTQNRFDHTTDGEFRFYNSLREMGSINADNILMLKATYWLNL